MATRTNPTTAAQGVLLDPAGFARHATLHRWPSRRYPRFVENYWAVDWDLPGATRYLASLVPVSAVNLTHEWGGSLRDGVARPGVYLTGVVSKHRFDVTLSGRGHVVGIKFRPGAFAVLTGLDAGSLRDRTVLADPYVARLGRLRAVTPQDRDPVCALDDFLQDQEFFEGQAGRPETGDLLARLALIDAAEAESVGALARSVGVTERTLERLSNTYIGVGPKWLLMRRRVHRALEQLNASTPGDLSGLAHDLGWFDYAHFSRDFKAITGRTPRAHVRDQQERRAAR